MSKGPGRRQRTIAALIEANPDGAWAYEDLCALIYGKRGFTRSQKSGVGRALKSMKLPGTWVVQQALFANDRRFWLFNPCRIDSWRKIAHIPGYNDASFGPGGVFYGLCEEAKRRAARGDL